MKKAVLFGLVILISGISLISCKNVDSGKLVGEIAGIYHGVLPCADCEGIETVVILNEDLTYLTKRQYKGKDQKIFEERGTFSFNKSGYKLLLTPENGEQVLFYSIGDGNIKVLNMKGKEIKGDLEFMYILNRDNGGLVEREWELIEINKKEVNLSEGLKTPFIRFELIDNRMVGNASCNNIFSKYEINGNNLNLYPVASTMMACRDNTIETKMKKMLNDITSYTLDGNTLKVKNGSGEVIGLLKLRD